MSESTSLSAPDFPNRIRSQDRDALATVVEAYLDQIVRAARGAGLNHQQAEEVAQETLTTFVETAPRFEGRSHVRTWVFGILYRKIKETRRALAKDRQMDDLDDVMESRFDAVGRWSEPPRGPDDLILAKEARQEIADCLDAAPEAQRMAFVFREVEGLSTEEICNTLDKIPPKKKN